MVYKTNDPFRCALVAGVGKLRYMLYPAESCQKCVSIQNRTKTKTIDSGELIELLQKSYSDQMILQVARQYLYVSKGIDNLPTVYRSLWNKFNHIDKEYFINWELVAISLEKLLKKPRKKGYNFTKKASEIKKNLEELASKKLKDTDMQNDTSDS